MKKVYNEYKENVKYFFTKKTYIIPLLIIIILCYGFYITNFSVGVDDFTQDRYVTGTYLLSQGRWGNVFLSRLLNITTFVPFWTEFIATMLIAFTAVILSAFVKKEIGSIVDKTIYYVLFSGIFISYPIIHHIFLYNITNIITGLTTLAMVIVAIIIYENVMKVRTPPTSTGKACGWVPGNLVVFTIKNNKIYFLLVLVLPFFISMYEACCQTFLIFALIICFINIVKNEKTNKKIFRYFGTCIIILAVGMIINVVVNSVIKSVLEASGKLTPDFSTRSITWLQYDFRTCLKILDKMFFQKLIVDIKNIDYIGLFFVMAIAVIAISLHQSIKRKNALYLIITVLAIIANFAIAVMQTNLIYRTSISWSLTIAFMALYLIVYFRKYEFVRIILVSLMSLIILYNSKTLTWLFYNENVRYEREKAIAFDIANTIIRECDNPKKPLVYIPYKAGDIQGNSINLDNGWPVFNWGINAFGEKGAEITKFINSLGYNFTTATNEEWKEAYEEFNTNKSGYDENYVIELDKYILVKVIYEPR